MLYIQAVRFLIRQDISALKTFWKTEYLQMENFSWYKLIEKSIKTKPDNFLFLWRLANAMYLSGNKKYMHCAKRIQNRIIIKYNMEIELGAIIGEGLKIHHYSSIIITKHAVIGKNFTCYQGVTIGWRKDPYQIKIGDNVTIGCGSTVLGGTILIGNNIKIGAMTLVTENVPDNCTYINERTGKVIRLKSSRLN